MATGYLTEQNLQVSRGLIQGSEVRTVFLVIKFQVIQL